MSLKGLEDLKGLGAGGPARGLWRTALWPVPPRWPGSTPCAWQTAAECAAISSSTKYNDDHIIY